jgi:hypothetical protein
VTIRITPSTIFRTIAMVRINIWQLFRRLDLTKHGEKFADIVK